MKKNNQIVVYWCPWWDPKKDINLDVLYRKPENVYRDLIKNFEPKDEFANFMNCPAVSEKLKRTYVIKNVAETEIEVFINDDGYPDIRYINTRNTNTPAYMPHAPTLRNQYLVEYQMAFGLFAEESLEVSMTSPFFHKAEHLKYGAIVPGQFDIGRWYRPLMAEFNLWSDNSKLHVPEGDPLMYWEFHTDKEIVLKRYSMTPKLFNIATTLINFKILRKWSKLLPRYQYFKESSMREIVLKEIKNNLID